MISIDTFHKHMKHYSTLIIKKMQRQKKLNHENVGFVGIHIYQNLPIYSFYICAVYCMSIMPQ